MISMYFNIVIQLTAYRLKHIYSLLRKTKLRRNLNRILNIMKM